VQAKIIHSIPLLRKSLVQATKTDLKLNGKNFFLGSPQNDRFFYLNCKAGDMLSIYNGGEKFFAGRRIQTKPKASKRLILPIFIDGLAADLLHLEGVEKTMPRTRDFFKDGLTFNQAYSASEWSLPSCATIFSGLRVKNHGLWHPHRGDRLSHRINLLPEYFQQDGYFTLQVCGNWRKNPALGYARGFDRTIYKREIESSQVVAEFFDQILALSHRKVFAWLTFFDLHRPWPYRQPQLSVQSGLSPFDLSLGSERQKKSIDMQYSKVAIRNYLAEMSRLDFWLGQLFDFIDRQYSDSEILVCLFADHGQSYLSNAPDELGANRTHIPFMIKGSAVPSLESDELVETTDILPALLHSAGINLPDTLDGQVPTALGGKCKRRFAFSETAFPGRKYKCIYRFEKGSFSFSSGGKFQGFDGLKFGDMNISGAESGMFENHRGPHLDSAKLDLMRYLGDHEANNSD
jgi:hypothetical protein